MGIIEQGLSVALVGQAEGKRQGGIVEGKGRGAGHGAGHIGDTVVHHALLHIGGLGMGSRAAGFKTPPLVDGHVDQYRAGFHGAQHGAIHQLGGRRTRDQHGTDQQVRTGDVARQGLPG